MNSLHRTRGFTLLELLIAISIFSVMAALAYGGLRMMLDGNKLLERSATELDSLQRTFLYLQQDLEQLAPRSVRDEFGEREEALRTGLGDGVLHLTRGGINGAIRGGADLRRVEYHLIEGSLVRLVWSVLDRVHDSESNRLRLVDGVQGVTLRFMGYDETDYWREYWPPESVIDENTLPKAVEITIRTEKFGAVSRLFVLGL
jgi:general secretion pathway protein J